jgi:hypothetical protein
MITRYLQMVAKHYQINFKSVEFIHASQDEEVGSRNDTIYVTNIRDPVGRSISNFKYNVRWDCRKLFNSSFATAENARPLEAWNQTHGLKPSPCGKPWAFHDCAVNCHIQAFTGKGCSSDDWLTEYNLAWNRLLRYNIILVFEKFKDPDYIEAVENFFGVKGLNKGYSRMWCGPESKKANERIPLNISAEYSRRLTKLNEMDNRLYSDLVSPCSDSKGEGGTMNYSFPAVDTKRFIAQVE